MLWSGYRTSQLDGAHVEYCRGIQNPIGMKCGPSLDADDLIRMIDVLNPRNGAGRLTLIASFGSDTVKEALPRLIRSVTREGRRVVWSCDTMQGTTVKTSND